MSTKCINEEQGYKGTLTTFKIRKNRQSFNTRSEFSCTISKTFFFYVLWVLRTSKLI